jgi:hypothetical protein
MRRFGVAVAFSVLMASTSAYAGITAVTGMTSNSVVGNDYYQASVASGSVTIERSENSYTSWNSVVDITSDHVSFESSNTASGPEVLTNSFSSVQIAFQNTGSQAVTPVLSSQIIPAGMGFYLGDRSLGCSYTDCIGTNDYNFGQLSNLGLSEGLSLATINFQFDISADDVTLYTISGAMELFVDGQGGWHIEQTIDSLGFGNFANGEEDLLDASHRLTGFASSWNTASAYAYAWDATDINVDFLTPLASMDTRTLTYTTHVSSVSRAPCIDDNADDDQPGSICLVAFAGFGDPVGRGGGNEAARGQANNEPVINGVNFSEITFNSPTYNDGRLAYEIGAVPEPATWLSMILGFGLLGTALRRRKALAFA